MRQLQIGLFLLMAAGSGPICGQSFSFGFKGGAPVTSEFADGFVDESRRYAAGPTVEVGLPLGLGIEVDALYRRSGYSLSYGGQLYSSATREADNVWEFPLLATYRLRVPVLKPFVEGGWAPRIAHGHSIESGRYMSSLSTYASYYSSSSTSWPTTHGAVVGGGLRISAGRITFAPELRYTRWNQPAVQVIFSDGPTCISGQNQVDFLLGVSFRMKR